MFWHVCNFIFNQEENTERVIFSINFTPTALMFIHLLGFGFHELFARGKIFVKQMLTRVTVTVRAAFVVDVLPGNISILRRDSVAFASDVMMFHRRTVVHTGHM